VGGGGCAGPVLGVADVNPGSGSWRFEETVVGSPSEVCVESPGGGSISALLQ
jgi:hypothetical protein